MCKLKSGIILKDRVYIPDHDRHAVMLEELNIADTRQNAERLFVRAELYPKDGDIFTAPDTWVYHVDQDILPDWYVAEVDEARMREAVKAWYGEHVHIDEDGLTVRDGVHWIKGGKNIDVCDSATVERICGSATVKYICGSATVEDIYGSATVGNICGSATVKRIYGSATVEDIYGSATVEDIRGIATIERICGSATVIVSGFVKWHNRDKAKVTGNATIKDIYSKQIIQAGDWMLIKSKEE